MSYAFQCIGTLRQGKPSGSIQSEMVDKAQGVKDNLPLK